MSDTQATDDRPDAGTGEPVPLVAAQAQELEPVHTEEERRRGQRWTPRLVVFLRVMAGLAMLKGLFHWAVLLGIGEGPDTVFTRQSMPWQTATVYFALIDLMAAVGLWLAATWGAVVWLTAAVSMAVVEVFFPQIYGGSIFIIVTEFALICCYLWLAILSAREHPQ
jgi:hypothetical protein